jgi:drug/metabolite transporter (DMT)-like permease
MWGLIFGEEIGWKQIISMAVILAGVWVANMKEKTVAAV